MIGADAALVAEVHVHFIPRNLRAQSGVAGQKGIQGFWSGTACEGYREGALLRNGLRCGLDEILSGAFADGVDVSQNSDIGWHNQSLRNASVGGLTPDGSDLISLFHAAAIVVDLFFADGAPRAAFAFEQLFGFHGSPRTGGIVGKAAGGQGVPDGEDQVDEGPTRF